MPHNSIGLFDQGRLRRVKAIKPKRFRSGKGKYFPRIEKKRRSVRLPTEVKCKEVKKVKRRLDKSGRIL